MKANGARFNNPPVFFKMAIQVYTNQVEQLINDFRRHKNHQLTTIGYTIKMNASGYDNRSSSNLYECNHYSTVHNSISQRTEATGYISVRNRSGTAHYASWSFDQTSNDGDDVLGSFSFTCDIHMQLCEMLECPCTCIESLVNLMKSNKEKETFPNLPIHIQNLLRQTNFGMEVLYFPAFHGSYGLKILELRHARNLPSKGDGDNVEVVKNQIFL